MALTARQRNALPDQAFAYPSTRSYPIPTRAHAKRAGITERQRIATHRAALAYAARHDTAGSSRHVTRVVRRRHNGKIKSLA